MTNRIQRGDLQVSEVLDKLISEKVCVNIGVCLLYTSDAADE